MNDENDNKNENENPKMHFSSIPDWVWQLQTAESPQEAMNIIRANTTEEINFTMKPRGLESLIVNGKRVIDKS